MRNRGQQPFPNGAKPLAGLTDRIMMFNVVAPAPGTPADTSRPPSQLTNLNRTDPIAPPTLADLAVTPREVALYETLDHMGRSRR